jgi:hypothetical protein
MSEETCAHAYCDCEVDNQTGITKEGKIYCSEFCASGEGASLEDCECGHDDCQ